MCWEVQWENKEAGRIVVSFQIERKEVLLITADPKKETLNIEEVAMTQEIIENRLDMN
jgi:hypothetical protein